MSLLTSAARVLSTGLLLVLAGCVTVGPDYTPPDLALPDSERQFEPLPRYPSATRDLALVMPSDVDAERVTRLILRHRGVDRAELFDIYAGENISEGTKSLAFHVYFQARDRTLTNEEVNKSLDGLLRTLERELNVTLRA